MCSVICGGGIKSSKWICNNLLLVNGGFFCLGLLIKIEFCNVYLCLGNFWLK